MKILMSTLLFCSLGLVWIQKMEVIITGEHQHKTVEEKPDFFAMEWQEGIVLNGMCGRRMQVDVPYTLLEFIRILCWF